MMEACTHRALDLRVNGRAAAAVELDGTCHIEWERIEEMAAIPFSASPDDTAMIAVARLLLHARNER